MKTIEQQIVKVLKTRKLIRKLETVALCGVEEQRYRDVTCGPTCNSADLSLSLSKIKFAESKEIYVFVDLRRPAVLR